VRADVVRIEVPALPEYLALVRMVVAGTARIDPLLDDERVDDLRVIVSEACTNAMEATAARHARAEDRGAVPTIAVECHLFDAKVEVLVTDSGGGFELGGLTALPPAADPSRLSFERGLGIPLIRALSDEAEITSGAEGTRVRVALRAAPPALSDDA
jgi:anti-sigma regulatory factor (Ser/Thr protein kinase)